MGMEIDARRGGGHPRPMRFRVFALTAIVSFAGLLGCSQKDLELSETAAPIILVSPSSSSFGDIQVGATSAPIWVYVSPGGVGNSSDLITAIDEGCPNFSVAPEGLPADVYKYCIGDGIPRVRDVGATALAPVRCSEGYEIVNYQFPAYFTPTIAGTQSCTITVVASGGNKTVTLSGNGLPPPREISLSRSSIAFGDVRRNAASTPQTVVVSNIGSSELAVSSATVSGAAFTMSGAGSIGIPGNSSYTYTLGCSPGAALGPLAGSFTVVSNDPDEGTLTVPLSCNGVDSNLTVEPSPISLQARVDEPQEVTVQLVNSGGAPMNVTNVTIDGTDLQLVAAPTGTIPAGGSMQARLRYTATAEAEVSGMLAVSFDGENRAVPVSARAKRAQISLSPDGDIDLGAVCVGNATTQELTVRGAGGADFSISGVTVTGEGFTGLTPGPYNVAGAGASSVVLRAQALATQPGVMTGSVVLATDIPGDPSRTINLKAEAFGQGLGAAPSTHDFGSIQVNEPSNVQQISLANCTGGLLAISSVAFAGADAADFRVVVEPSKSVQDLGSTTMLIEMRPRTSGPKSASLVVTHAGGITEIPLVGDGFVLEVEAEKIGTYYACSTSGGASGLWMLGLGMAVLALRRRRA
jgi:hypothetical protein